MNCYTLTKKNEILSYIDFRDFRWCQKFKKPAKVKTAALRLYAGDDWSCADVVNSMRYHDNPEALLYTIAYFAEGDSRSALLPDDTFLLSAPIDHCKICTDMPEEWTMPVLFNLEKVIYLCYEGRTFIQLPSGDFLTNVKGTPTKTNTIDKPLEPEGGMVWEF